MHRMWEDETPRRELAPKNGPQQSDVDAVARQMLKPIKAIGSDSPEHHDRGSRKVVVSGDDIDWQGYYREAGSKLCKWEARLKGEALSLDAWTDALKRDQKRIDDQKRGLWIGWAVYAIAVIVMMLVGNGFLGR